MKKIVSIIFAFCLLLSVSAEELANIPYKNIKEEGKIKYVDDVWSDNVTRKDNDYFIKFISAGTGNYSEFYKSNGEFAFTTGCQYEFIYKGDLIGYANQDLKFYDFIFVNGEFIQRELTPDEVQVLFPDYTIVKISEFSPNTNSLKIKKKGRNFKVILLNDTDKSFYHYSFTSGNAKFEHYPLTGFINIKKKGMFHFSHFGENTAEFPWYVLLVR